MTQPAPPVSRHMTTTPQTVPSGASVAAAAKTMRAHQIRHLPVVDDGRIVGLVSERDIGVVEGLVGFDPQAVTVGDIMARSPYTVAPDTSIADVARGMTETRYGS